LPGYIKPKYVFFAVKCRTLHKQHFPLKSIKKEYSNEILYTTSYPGRTLPGKFVSYLFVSHLNLCISEHAHRQTFYFYINIKTSWPLVRSCDLCVCLACENPFTQSQTKFQMSLLLVLLNLNVESVHYILASKLCEEIELTDRRTTTYYP